LLDSRPLPLHFGGDCSSPSQLLCCSYPGRQIRMRVTHRDEHDRMAPQLFEKTDVAANHGMNVDVPESPKCRESPEHAQGFASRFSRYRPLRFITGMSRSWRYSRRRGCSRKTAG